MKKSKVLRDAIMRRQAVVVPGAYDAMSAKVIEAAGFEAIQVSGFGLAGSFLGQPDVGLLQFKDVLELTAHIADAVDIPVMADVDTGGGNAINAAETVRNLIMHGVAGMNIEDQVSPKRCGHMGGKMVIGMEEMAGKVSACVDMRDRMDKDFIINARTDVFAIKGIDAAIERCNRYLECGADLVFIDGIAAKTDIEKAVANINGPLSVNLMDGVTGVKTEILTIPELAEIGVARVSIPVAAIMVAYKRMMEFFKALRAAPEGILPGQTQWVPTFKEYTDFVGLGTYKELEDKFLPESILEDKYHGLKKIVE